MGTEDREEESPLQYGSFPSRPRELGDVYIFWSTGHQAHVFSGEEEIALREYMKALRFSQKHLEELPKELSKVRVREHHVVEFLINRTWDIDPIRTRERLRNQAPWWDERSKGKFTGTIITALRSSGHENVALVPLQSHRQLQPLARHLNIVSPYHTVVFLGDDPTEEIEKNRFFLEALCSEIANVVRTYHGVAVVDRARKSMVTQLLGKALTYQSLPYIGVACAKTGTPPNTSGIQGVDISELELAHTVVVLVPGTQRTDEATWLAKTASVVAGKHSSLALLIHGDEYAWADVLAQLREHRRVVVLEGTGGIADLLSRAVRGEQVDDERAAKCIASGLIRTIPIDALDEFKQLLQTLVFPFPSGLRNIGMPEHTDLEQEFVEVSGTTITIRVPRFRPILRKEDWFTIEKWFVKEGDIIHPGEVLVSIECAPGFFEVSTPPQAVQGPCRVLHIPVPAGESTSLGDVLLVLVQGE